MSEFWTTVAKVSQNLITKNLGNLEVKVQSFCLGMEIQWKISELQDGGEGVTLGWSWQSGHPWIRKLKTTVSTLFGNKKNQVDMMFMYLSQGPRLAITDTTMRQIVWGWKQKSSEGSHLETLLPTRYPINRRGNVLDLPRNVNYLARKIQWAARKP